MADSRDTNRDGHVSMMEKVKDKLHLGHKDKDAEYTTTHTTTASHHSTTSHHTTQAVMPVAGLVPVAGVIPVAGTYDASHMGAGARDLNHDGHISTTEKLAGSSHMGAGRDLNRDGHVSTTERLATSHMGASHMGASHEGTRLGHAGTRQDESVMRLHEEQLAVSKREVGAGQVDIHKRVQEEHVQQTIPVRREEVTVERRPLHGAADPNARIASQDEVIRVPLHREEIMTEKRIVPTEEVIVHKNQVLGEQTVGANLRKEYVETTQTGATHGASLSGEKRRLDTNHDGHVSMGEKLKSTSPAARGARG